MTRDLTVQNTQEIIQGNALIEASYSLSSLQTKIVQFILGGISPMDSDLCAYRFKISDLRDALRLKGRSLTKKVISGHLEALRQEQIEIKGEVSTIHCGWISSWTYYRSGEKVEVFIDPKLKPFLIGLKARYTKALREMLFRFSTPQAARLYLLLKQYEPLEKRRIEIGDLRYMLKIKDNEYRRFNDFRRRIITKSVNTMNESTDISVRVDEERVGRKVVALNFTITPQPYQEILPLPLDDARIEKRDISNPGLVERLCHLGISREEAFKAVSQDAIFEEETVKAVEKYLKRLTDSGETILSSPQAIYKKAKREKWAVKSDWEREQEKKKLESKKALHEQEKKTLQDRERAGLRSDFDRERRSAAFKIYQSMTQSEQREVKSEVEGRLSGAALSRFREMGFETVPSRIELVKNFEKSLSKDLQDFDKWIQKNRE